MEPEIGAKNPRINTKKSMTAQTRLLLSGLALSTVFIFCTAGFAVYSIDKNMNNAYKNFGQVLSKTLAIEGVELTKEVPQLAKFDTLRSNSISILKSNNDIAFIIFKSIKSLRFIKSYPKFIVFNTSFNSADVFLTSEFEYLIALSGSFNPFPVKIQTISEPSLTSPSLCA